MFFRALGSIPGPIIFGALFDASCVYWQEECGDRGNCWVYHNEDLSLRMFGVAVGVRIASVVFALCTWIFYDVTLCNRGQVADETETKEIRTKSPEVAEIEMENRIESPEVIETEVKEIDRTEVATF